MTAQTINSAEGLQSFIGDLRSLWDKHKYLRVSIKTGKDRSLPQNAITHAWYSQIARELREDDAAGHKRFCKLHFAIPILIAEDEEFRVFYMSAIKNNLTYEQKLKAMDFIPATSLMTKIQLSQYLEQIQSHFIGRGVFLEFPID